MMWSMVVYPRSLCRLLSSGKSLFFALSSSQTGVCVDDRHEFTRNDAEFFLFSFLKNIRISYTWYLVYIPGVCIYRAVTGLEQPQQDNQPVVKIVPEEYVPYFIPGVMVSPGGRKKSLSQPFRNRGPVLGTNHSNFK